MLIGSFMLQSKDESHIKVGPWLKISTIDGKSHFYEVTAMVNHLGIEAKKGHWRTNARKSGTSFYCIDDTALIRKSTHQELLEGTMFIYKRMSTN